LAPQDDDGDPEHEWDDARTILDAIVVPVADPVTAPHDLQALPGFEVGRSKGKDEGCRACWSEGQEDALGALRSILLERGLTNEEAAHLVLLVRGRLTSL
jgi:hypothetical protein